MPENNNYTKIAVTAAISTLSVTGAYLLYKKYMKNSKKSSADNSTTSTETAPIVEEKKEVIAPIVEEKKEVIAPIVEEKKEVILPVVEEKKEVIAPIVEEKKEVIAPIVEEKKEVILPVVEEKKEVIAPIVEEKKEVIAPIVEEKKEVILPVVEETLLNNEEEGDDEHEEEDDDDDDDDDESSTSESEETPVEVTTPIEETKQNNKDKKNKKGKKHHRKNNNKKQKKAKTYAPEILELAKIIENPKTTVDDIDLTKFNLSPVEPVPSTKTTTTSAPATKTTVTKKPESTIPAPVKEEKKEEPKTSALPFIPGFNYQVEPEPVKTEPKQPKVINANVKQARSICVEANKSYKAKNYSSALDKYDAAINILSDTDADDKKIVYFSRAKTCLKMNLNQQAITDFTNAITLDPTYSKAFLNRAIVYKQIHNDDAALEDYTFASLLDTYAGLPTAELDADAVAIIDARATKLAKQEIENRKHNSGSNTYLFPSNEFITFYLQSLLSEQYDCLNTNKYTLDELNEKINNFSDDTATTTTTTTATTTENDDTLPIEPVLLCDLYAARGEVYKTQHLYPESMEDYKKAYELGFKKNIGYLYLELGTYYHLMGDYDNALKFYNLHKSVCVPDINFYCKIGGYYYEVGNVDKSEAMFTAAVKKGKKHPDGYYHRGQMYTLTGNINKALDDLRKAASYNPSFTHVYIYLATLEFQRQNVDAMWENIHKAIDLDPTNAQAFTQIGEFYSLLGNDDLAKMNYEQAIKLQPSWPYPYIGMAGVILRSTADFEKAEEYLNKALKADDRCVQAYTQLASVYLTQRRIDEYKQCIQNAIKYCHIERDLIDTFKLKITSDYQIIVFDKYLPVILGDNENSTEAKPTEEKPTEEKPKETMQE